MFYDPTRFLQHAVNIQSSGDAIQDALMALLLIFFGGGFVILLPLVVLLFFTLFIKEARKASLVSLSLYVVPVAILLMLAPTNIGLSLDGWLVLGALALSWLSALVINVYGLVKARKSTSID